MNNNSNKQKINMPRPNLSWLYIIIAMTIAFLYITSDEGSMSKEITYTEFKEMVKKGYADKIIAYDNNSVEMYIKPENIVDVFKKDAPKVGKSPSVKIQVGSMESLDKFLDEEQKNGNFTGSIRYEKENDYFGVIFWNLLPIIFFIGLWIFIMRRMGGAGNAGGAGNVFNVGKSKAQLFEKGANRVTFKDVAGQTAAKQEVQEIVEFLKQPQKYTELGGKIPKGALLVGPPGTGKTLLAKAVAGEADVPFFSMSGSDFVEMFVGVGASRVRDLFKQAKEKAPCIVFIDEIDAIGRARSKNGGFSGNDERENTLNQLLTEMDGFGTNSGVIILAATNRVDILDKALMRAGRFDRQITVDLPELSDRVELFKVHTRKLKIASDFDPDFFAKQTPGFSGADIANICNEAALIAARKSKQAIEKQDFLDAIDRVVGGLERKSLVMTQEQKKATAYHEAGHAMVHWMLPKADTVLKVTIIPRGNSLGATWFLPDERHTRSRTEMLDEMTTLVAGRVGEKIFTGELSTGAANDLDRATSMAYNMIMVYGMGESVPNLSYYGLISNGNIGTKPFSDKTADEIDKEVRRMVDDAMDRAESILTAGRDKFVRLAELLYEKEVIFAEDIESVLGPKVKTEEVPQ